MAGKRGGRFAIVPASHHLVRAHIDADKKYYIINLRLREYLWRKIAKLLFWLEGGARPVLRHCHLGDP